MTKRSYWFVALAVLLGALVLYVNRDWFARAPIQISHRFHAFAGRFNGQSATPIMFEFNRKLKLTSVKVVLVSEALTNKYPHALWHLVSESNSLPTRGFVYGMKVPGMRTALKGAEASALEPGVDYRLLLQAGSFKAQHDFAIEPP